MVNLLNILESIKEGGEISLDREQVPNGNPRQTEIVEECHQKTG
jgi:hypothetical protein